MSRKTIAIQILISVLLSGVTGSILSSLAAIPFGDQPFSVSLMAPLMAPIYRAIVLSVALIYGWDQDGKFLEMHLWLAVGATVNFLLMRRTAARLYGPKISN